MAGVVERDGGKLRAIDYGCLETLPTQELPQRLLEIHRAVTELILTHQPVQVGVERLFFNRNVQTAFAVGQARGVVLLAAAEHGLDLDEPTDEQYLDISPHLTPAVRGVLTVEGSVTSRSGVGGTAPARVAEQRAHLTARVRALTARSTA